MDWVVGVDGCRAGWIAAFVRGDSRETRVRVVPRFADVLTAPEDPAVVAVDIPIGLPQRLGPGGRGPEAAVRPLLGGRQSSVFSVPSRRAVWAPDYRQACRIALQTSEPARKVSRQLFAIAPKICEVDALLRSDASLGKRVYETHPEVAFWRLNGERPLAEPKKIKGTPYGAGLALRRDLLRAAGLSAAVLEAAPPCGAGADDLLDALACAVMAQRIDAGLARPFPDPPGRDEHGLAIAIWA